MKYRFVIASAAVTCCTIQAYGDWDNPPLESLEKLPLCRMGRDDASRAKLHALDKSAAVISFQGKRFTGFRTETPGHADGGIIWLTAGSLPSGATFWHLVDAKGKTVTGVQTLRENPDAYPHVAQQFPSIRSITLQRAGIEPLPRRIYTVLRELADDEEPPLAAAVTIGSELGEYQWGRLQNKAPVPPAQLTASGTMARMMALRDHQDIEGAIQCLSDELDRRADRRGDYGSLFYNAWKEAQMGSGRDDAVWGARIFDQMYRNAEKNRYYGEMYEATNNTSYTLSSAGFHARDHELMARWKEAQMQGGHRMDPSAYPDLGAPLPMLPQVRLRDMPVVAAYSKAVFKGAPPRSLPPAANSNGEVPVYESDAGAFLCYSAGLTSAGHWEESLEWDLWIRHWASEENGDPRGDRVQAWYGATTGIVGMLNSFGYYDESLKLVEAGIAAPYGLSYRGRQKILFAMDRLALQINMDRLPSDFVEQARKLQAQAEDNLHIGQRDRQRAGLLVADGLRLTGHPDEAMAIINGFADAGNFDARLMRMRQWVRDNKLDLAEKEILALLKITREGGLKQSEIFLYQEYAGILEKAGRYAEALTIQREYVRLCRSFHMFHKLPDALARLAVILAHLGDAKGSAIAAAQARSLLDLGHLPGPTRKNTMETLDLLKTIALNPPAAEAGPEVDLQPVESIVIPIQGASWTTLLTLANPSTRSVEGTLACKGMAATFARDAITGDILVSAAKPAAAMPGLTLKLDPESYQRVEITAGAGSALEGEVSFNWTSARSNKTLTSTIRIEAPETGVASSIIQAGNYRYNPFYGVPVHMQYVSKDPAETSVPLRFVCSARARVEVYADDGTPLCIDDQGNGTLGDVGDELFAASDGAGNLLLPLAGGSSSFMVLIYPDGPLPADGITLNVDAWHNGWATQSQNRLKP